jgi:hypothetical protein
MTTTNQNWGRKPESMKFARLVFNVAGVYGLLVLLPQYFMEGKTGRDFPPPINHPEYYYGFIGVAVAWQFLFLILAREPRRYYPLIPAAVLEKLSFGVAVALLYAQGRVGALMLGAGLLDLALAALFVAAYVKVSRQGDARGW